MLALAAHLGMTVGRLLKEMTMRELAMWRLEYSVRPWGEVAANYRAAQWCAMYANAHRDPKKRAEPWSIDDFRLFKDAEPLDDEGEPIPKDIVAPETKAWFYAMAKRSEGAN